MPCNKVQGYLTTQRNPSVFYWGLRSQCVFIQLPLTHSNRVRLWNAECWKVNQHQHVFAGKSLCV